MKILIILISALVLAACKQTPPPVAQLTGDQICVRDLKSHVVFKDPDSVRVNKVSAGDEKASFYNMSVSAKNSYGGYGDSITCSCTPKVATDEVIYLYCEGQ